jgi:hypothetical protein
MKTKLFMLMCLVLLLLPAWIWSQGVAPFSLESFTSFGVFENPIDAAFNVTDVGVGPNFSTLEKSLFFSGLTNFGWDLAQSINAESLKLGYYNKATMPWSVYGDVQVGTTTSGRSNGIGALVATTTAGKPVGVNTETWTTQTTEEQYIALDAWNNNIAAQFLVGLGFMNIGGWVRWINQDNYTGVVVNTYVDANRTTIQTNYYDTAVAGVAPAPAVNYTLTTAQRDPDSQFTFSFGVPFFLKLGTMGLTASLDAALVNRDVSDSLTNAYTAPVNAGAGNFNNVAVLNSDVNTYGSINVNADALLTLPAIFGSHKDNNLQLGVNGGVVLNTVGTRVQTDIQQDYSYAGGGAALVPSWDGTDPVYQVITDTRQGALGYDAGLTARHPLYFDAAPSVQIGFIPGISTGVQYRPLNAYITTQRVQVDNTDVTNNGLFTDATDTITTTTTTYYNNGDGGTMDITINLSLPASIRFKPEGSPFGITLGNSVNVGASIEMISNLSNTAQTHTVTADATTPTTPITDVTTTQATSYTLSRTNVNWSFSNSFYIALNFFLPAGITLDVLLNMVAGGPVTFPASLFQFNNMSIQAVIPL